MRRNVLVLVDPGQHLIHVWLYNKKYFMDISELWSWLALLLVPVGGWILFHFAKYIRRRWLRTSARAIASVFLALSFVILMLLVLVELGCSEHSQIYSPDRRRVLVVSYTGQGALGADYASISIRPRWSPFAKRIFSGEAQWDFKLHKLASPELKWLDNSRLSIRYYGDATCERRAENIEIICVK
jgi:hypothetical protein